MSVSLRHYSRGYDLVSMQTATGEDSIYHYDHQGTTQCLTDVAMGIVTDRFASDSWGLQVKRTGSSINRQWYVGASGYYRVQALDYVRARYLTASTGRFLSVDPLSQSRLGSYDMGMPIGLIRFGRESLANILAATEEVPEANWFGYAQANPARFIDPSGLRCIGPPCKISGDPCAWAKIWGKDFGHMGGVYCCDGKKYVCDWSDGRVPQFQLKCILQHEEAHIRDANTFCQANGRLGFPDAATQNRGECFAHWTELLCLLKELKACGPRNKPGARLCRRPVSVAISGVCSPLEDYCQAAGMPIAKICGNIHSLI